MRDIVTEDIIRSALNESIDEFMLEEGWEGWKNLWNNPNVQKIRNGVGKAWNGYKNFLAMYMDNKTNGQWNNKYGIYASGSGKTTELYYLQKWFGYHLDNIRQIERRNETPAADFSRSREYVERNGEKVYTDTEIQEKDTLTYVQKNITPNNFNTWIKNFIKDRQALELIDTYINNCSKNITNLQTAIKWLNMGSFMSSKEGQNYLKTKQNDLTGQRQKYQKENDKKNTIKLFDYLYNNSKKITKQLLSQNIDNLNTKFGISDTNYQLIKKYILGKLQMMNDNDTIYKRVQYFKGKTFLKIYGGYYK